jgi:hypothetical protein
MSIVAGIKIVLLRLLCMKAVLPCRNKEHLIPLIDSAQLNGKLHLRRKTGNNAVQCGVGGASQLLDLHGTIFLLATL